MAPVTTCIPFLQLFNKLGVQKLEMIKFNLDRWVCLFEGNENFKLQITPKTIRLNNLQS
jgi:hypothetical protein